MRRLSATFLTVALVAAAMVPLRAAETDGPSSACVRARRNRALVDRYGSSFATVRYFVKKDAEGREPSFRVPYICPNCGNTHWNDTGVSVEKGIPAEFIGFVLSPDEILVQDSFVAPEHVDRIEVMCAGETVSAVESEACPDQGALVLKTARPLKNAAPVPFTAGGEPESPDYFYIARDDGVLVAAVTKSGVSSFRRMVEIGKDVYKTKANTLVLDGDGNAVTVNFRSESVLGEESFAPPSAWRRVPAAARFEARAALKARFDRAVLPVYVQLESVSKNEDWMMTGGISVLSSEERSGDDHDTVAVLLGDMVLVPCALGPKDTARILKIEATLPSGSKVALDFVGSLAEHGAFVARFRDGRPAGLDPLVLDTRPAFTHYDETLGVLSFRNRGGRLEVRPGECRVRKFGRARGNVPVIDLSESSLTGPASEAGDSDERRAATQMLFSSKGLVSFGLRNRRGGKWDSPEDLQGAALAALAVRPVFDPENVPRSAEDRKRRPWLGVEVQIAGVDALRERKATSFIKDYLLDNAVLVTAVATNSPAAEMGIRSGDVLLSAKYPDARDAEDLVSMTRDFDGINWSRAFEDERFLEFGGRGVATPWPNAAGGINGVLAAKFAVDAEIIVAWVRDGRRMEGRGRLGLAPPSYGTAPRVRCAELGVTVADMTEEVRRYFKFGDTAPGVVVAKVKSGGIAAVAGLKPLEIVIEVDGEGVTSAKDFARRTKGRTSFTLTVRRLTATRMVPIGSGAR